MRRDQWLTLECRGDVRAASNASPSPFGRGVGVRVRFTAEGPGCAYAACPLLRSGARTATASDRSDAPLRPYPHPALRATFSRGEKGSDNPHPALRATPYRVRGRLFSRWEKGSETRFSRREKG